MTDNSTTILLDIYEKMNDVEGKMGRVEGQNELILKEQERAADGRRDLYAAIEDVRREVATVTHAVGDVTRRTDAMEPNVTEMADFRVKIAVSVVFVTGIVTGAFNLIVLGISNFNQLMAALRELLR